VLRAFVIGLGVVFLLGATLLAAGVHAAWPAAIELAIVGLLIIGGTLLERRYHTPKPTPEQEWKSTGERFVDPTSGKLVDVRYNPATGERAYVDTDQR
jgi:hypothetical protein